MNNESNLRHSIISRWNQNLTIHKSKVCADFRILVLSTTEGNNLIHFSLMSNNNVSDEIMLLQNIFIKYLYMLNYIHFINYSTCFLPSLYSYNECLQCVFTCDLLEKESLYIFS